MINVEINIESVFAQFENVNELKEVAQSVVNQINSAYKARLAELQSKTKAVAPLKVAVSASTKGEKSVTKATKDTTKTKEPVSKTTKTAKTTTKATKKAEKKPKEEVEQIAISSLTKAQIKAMDIQFVQYSDKCMFISGNTRCIKDEIMAMGGAHWNGNRQGWFIKNESAKKLAKALKIKIA